ncbi:zinc finger protein 723-like [Malaya genurostris]|uniref:zinc finger protein 723-like n=1 Tax=Malaya genurostris TaxID=325434 RepID=UPI0026F3A7A6|nr:zinc finger protein 723-like [Malaya genurostris]
MELESSIANQAEQTAKLQFDDFCRLCLMRKAVLLPLTSEFNGIMIPEMLWKVSGTLINVLEPLPRVVCERCLNKLDLAYSIAQEFRKQEERLRSFCWKGLLLEELERFQQSEDALQEKYSEEVILKLLPVIQEQKDDLIEETTPKVIEKISSPQLDDIIETDSSLSESLDMIVEEINDEEELVKDKNDTLDVIEQLESAKETPQTLPNDVSDVNSGYDLLSFTINKLDQEEWIESEHESSSVCEKYVENDSQEMVNFICEDSGDSQDPTLFEQANKRQQNRQAVPNECGLFVCTQCSKTFKVRKTFQNHVKRHDHVLKGSFKCSTCHKAFGTKDRLTRHAAIHEQNLCCHLCGHVGQDGHDMRAHRILHEKGKYRCGCCKFYCDTSEQLQKHVDEGTCLVKFRNKKIGLVSYRDKKAPILKSSTCPFDGCNYTAETYGAMYVHKRAKHLQQYKCASCGKRFAFANQLRVHEKLHTGEKPFKCDVCPKRFRRMFSYKEHMAIHRGAEAYSCELCGKSFTRPRYLTAHMLTHSEDRSYGCSLCGNRYKTNGELNKHVRTKHESLEYGNGSDLIVEDYDYFEEDLCI